MAGISPPEISSAVRKVALERGGKAPVPGEVRVATPVQKLAENAKEHVDRPRTVLEGFREASNTPDRPSASGIDRIGTRDEKGERHLNNTEQNLKTRAENADKLNRDFAQKGYEGLTSDQKTVARERFAQILERDPEMATLKSANPGQFEKLVVEHLTDPKFRAKLNERVADSGNINTSLDDAILREQREFRGKELAFNQVDRKIMDKKAELEGVKTDQEQYEDRSATGGRVGERLREIQELQAHSPTSEDIARMTGDVQQLRDDLADLRQFQGRSWGGSSVTPDSLAQKRADLRKAEADLGAANGKITRKAQLEQDRDGLKYRRGVLEGDIDSLELERNNAQTERELASVSARDAEAKWLDHQKNFVEDLERVIDGSAADFIEDRLVASETVIDELIAKQIVEAATKEEKAIIAGLDAIYGRGPNRHVEVGILSKHKEWRVGNLPVDVIQKHMDVLLARGDPRFILESALSRAIDPATGQRLLTAAEVAEKINDPDFVQQNCERAVEALIKAKIKTGLRPDEATVLAESPWGKYTIVNQLTKAEGDLKDKVEEIKQAMGVKDEKELVEKIGPKNLLQLLLMIFGSLAIATIKELKFESK